MTDEVLTKEQALWENMEVAEEFVVKPPARRVPEFIQFAVQTSEARIVEMPSYDVPGKMYNYRMEMRFRPDQAYQMAKAIVDAVEEGLGAIEQDRVMMHINIPVLEPVLRTMANEYGSPPVSGLCTPLRFPITRGGIDE